MAVGGTLGKLEVWLTARDQASGKMRNLGRAIKFFATSVAALAIIRQVRESALWADEIGKLATAFNMTVQEIQGLQYAAKLLDADFEKVAKTIARLQVAANYAAKGQKLYADAFDALRINVTNASGNLKTGMELFLEISDALHEGTLTTEEFASAAQLLGIRMALDVMPMMIAGKKAIQEYLDESKRVGELTPTQISALRDLTDAVDKLQQKWKRFVAAMAADVVPLLQWLGRDLLPALVIVWKEWTIAIAHTVKWYYQLTKAMNMALGYSAGAEYAAKQIAIIEGNIISTKREIELLGQAFATEMPKGIKSANDMLDDWNDKVRESANLAKSAFGAAEWMPSLMAVGGGFTGTAKMGTKSNVVLNITVDDKRVGDAVQDILNKVLY